MGTVVVGLDGSETARKAFLEAVREAQWRGANLLAVHVVRYPVMAGYELGVLDHESLEALGSGLLATELETLEELFEDGFPVEVTPLVRIGHTGVEIIEVARGEDGEEHADLVVLGTRGIGGFRGLLVGSVTSYAAHHLPCRLLIVPSEPDED